MTENNRLIWFKGNLVPADQALVPVLSPTAQFGLNVFEGIRGYWSAEDKELYLFRLPEHLRRLEQSCKLIGIETPYSSEEITAALRDVLKANNYRCDIAVRSTIFVDGEGSWSNSSPVSMFIAPIAKDRRALSNHNGASGCISTWERIDDRSLPPRVKAGANYINGRYAHLEAQANGYDLPLLLDRHGKVAEGAGSCMMMVRNGTLITPPTSASILESITRETLLLLARDAGLEVEIRNIDRTELYLADEIFLCGSAAEITPITRIDRYSVGDGYIGMICADLLERYQKVTDGRNTQYRNWLTAVWNEA